MRIWILLVFGMTQLGSGGWLRGEVAQGEHGMVATGNPMATQAAVDAIGKGGNAVDAAVAAALTLGVVDGGNSGIGGGCFLLIRTAAGEMVAIDGRETAPVKSTRDMFLRDGKADTKLSQTGALASGTPGALAAYELALRRYGKVPLKTHLLAAAEMAEHGFTVDALYAGRLRANAEDLRRFPASRAVYCQANGETLGEGDVLKQPDLAATYRHIAEEGTQWFYRGAFAKAAAQWMAQNGGVLAAKDFELYEAKLREPVRSTYRGHEIISFPPPSSGGVHVLEILNMLEGFDLRAMGAGSADAIHITAEAMKLAFADRAFWLGDPEFARVPRGLIAKEYASKLAARIDKQKVIDVSEHGTPRDAAENVFGKHTTHLSTADAAGNWVALTATINTTFGSKVIIPGTGVVMNNEMDDFSVQPGVPNAFKLIGGEANAVEPGKRPLSSMSPTIVLKDGRPILAVGAAGGPTIISQTLLAIVNTIDFRQELGAWLWPAHVFTTNGAPRN